MRPYTIKYLTKQLAILFFQINFVSLNFSLNFLQRQTFHSGEEKMYCQTQDKRETSQDKNSCEITPNVHLLLVQWDYMIM